MSTEWREVADIIHHLGQVASMEGKEAGKRDGTGIDPPPPFPPPTYPTLTVWEREELCVRYVIEESKTNMLLRLMIEFKTFTFGAGAGLSGDPDAMGVMKTYEAGLGELLRCLLMAVEALQTLDIPAFIEYAEDMLNSAIAQGNCDAQSQEVVVVAYIYAIVTHLDRLDEDRVMSLFLDHHILPLLLHHFELYREKIGDIGVEVCGCCEPQIK